MAGAGRSGGDGQVKLYRSVNPLISPTGLMRMPCGACPVSVHTLYYSTVNHLLFVTIYSLTCQKCRFCSTVTCLYNVMAIFLLSQQLTSNDTFYFPPMGRLCHLLKKYATHMMCATFIYGTTINDKSSKLHMCVHDCVHFPLETLSLTLTFKISCFKVKCKFAFRTIVGKLLMIRLSNFTSMFAIMGTTIVTRL